VTSTTDPVIKLLRFHMSTFFYYTRILYLSYVISARFEINIMHLVYSNFRSKVILHFRLLQFYACHFNGTSCMLYDFHTVPSLIRLYFLLAFDLRFEVPTIILLEVFFLQSTCDCSKYQLTPTLYSGIRS
jgi:hypothetical protein